MVWWYWTASCTLWAAATTMTTLSARRSGTTRRRTRGRRWRLWGQYGILTPRRCSTASCMLWEASADDGILSSVERYDPATNAWEPVAPLAEARHSHAVAVLDGKLYAVGGYGGGVTLSLVERYDPATNAWEAVAPMVAARAAVGVAVLDGKLYAVGGCNNGDCLSSVERYDPVTNAWEAVAPMTSARMDGFAVSLM